MTNRISAVMEETQFTDPSVEFSEKAVELMSKQIRHTMKAKNQSSVLLLIAATLLAASVQAQQVYWANGTNGNWSNPTSWAGGDIADLSSEIATFNGGDNTAIVDANYTIKAVYADWSAGGFTSTLTGPGTLTLVGGGAWVPVFANRSGAGPGSLLSFAGNYVLNNAGNVSDIRTQNNAGNVTELAPGSTLTLNSTLVTLDFTGGGGSIELNGTLTGSENLMIQSPNASFNAGHDSSAFGGNILLNGDGAKLAVNGGTVLSSARTITANYGNSELELNGANAMNGGNVRAWGTSGLLLDVNSDQQNMGAITQLDAGAVLTIDLDASVSDLWFADSSGAGWDPATTVSILGFQEGVIRFGTDASGLTGGQLAAIDGAIYSLSGQGYLTLVPEPTTSALLLLSGMGLLAARRMRV